jgi:hypothetical protein
MANGTDLFYEMTRGVNPIVREVLLNRTNNARPDIMRTQDYCDTRLSNEVYRRI